MMRIVQSIAIGAIGSEYFDDRVGKRYAAFEGIVYDLGQIAACLDRIEAMLTGEVARDDLDEALRTKRAECAGCKYDRVCEGVWVNYLKRYGWDEMVPIAHRQGPE